MKKLLATTAVLALMAGSANAQIVDPTDLHLNAPGGTGTDPVLLNNSQTFTLSDVNASQSAFNIELIFAVPQFGITPVTPPTVGTLSTNVAGQTIVAQPEVNFTTTNKAGADLFSTSDTTDKDLYGYIGCTPCDNSLNKGNFEGAAFMSLFTAAQLATLTGFDVFEVGLTLANPADLPPQDMITVGSTLAGKIADLLPLGTYVAALAFEADGVTPLDTSFTNTGLVNKTGAPPPPPPPVPEPTSLVLLGTGLVGLGIAIHRRQRKNLGGLRAA